MAKVILIIVGFIAFVCAVGAPLLENKPDPITLNTPLVIEVIEKGGKSK